MKKLALFLLVSLWQVVSFSQNLYDIDHITTIEITFDDSDWDATLDTYYANDLDERLLATVVVNGVIYEGAGVKFKGNSTYSASNTKNPLNIKLDYTYDQTHQGYTTLKLSNGKNDPSFLREVLSYEIGRKYMDMPLSNYAYVTINGSDYGLFSSSESINGNYVERRFYSDRNNARFKCNPVDVMGGGSSLTYFGGDSSYYFDYYELKTDLGWNDLVQLCYQLYFDPFSLENYLDVDRTLWMLAFNNVLANMDSYSGPFRQNYYLIKDDNGRFLSVIWDLNECIGGFEMVNSPSGGPPSPPVLTDLTEMAVYLREGDIDWPLIYYLFQVPRYKKMYLAHCRTIYEENLASDQYYTRATEIQGYIEDAMADDPNAFYSTTEFYNNLDNSSGTGMGATYGVQEILDGRKVFLSSTSEYSLLQPTITGVLPSSGSPSTGDVVTINAEIADANYAYLGYRTYTANIFTKVEMFDDGLHGDGPSGDGVYGASISITGEDVQYYVYAENDDAGKFSPVRAEHEYYTISIASSVVINEIMPKNNGTVADQDNEYDDWVEFYNNSASTVDLSGFYLSDDILFPMKYEIPSGTTIAPGEYLIIWCDQDTLQSGLHAPFKLTSGGETLTLYDNSMNVVNQVTYPEMEAGTTYGRYINGSGAFQRLMPTFNAENSYTTLKVIESKGIGLSVYPNPSIDDITITGLEDMTTMLVYGLKGDIVYQSIVNNNQKIDLSLWKPGIYILYFPQYKESIKLIKQ